MAVWAILAAPLLMSTDLKNIRPEFRDILINRQIIAVNQDELGIQGKRIQYERKIEVISNFVRIKAFFPSSQLEHIIINMTIPIKIWLRPITPFVNGSLSYAVAWVSKRDDGAPYALTVKLCDLGLNHVQGYKVTVSEHNSHNFRAEIVILLIPPIA